MAGEEDLGDLLQAHTMEVPSSISTTDFSGGLRLVPLASGSARGRGTPDPGSRPSPASAARVSPHSASTARQTPPSGVVSSAVDTAQVSVQTQDEGSGSAGDVNSWQHGGGRMGQQPGEASPSEAPFHVSDTNSIMTTRGQRACGLPTVTTTTGGGKDRSNPSMWDLSAELMALMPATERGSALVTPQGTAPRGSEAQAVALLQSLIQRLDVDTPRSSGGDSGPALPTAAVLAAAARAALPPVPPPAPAASRAPAAPPAAPPVGTGEAGRAPAAAAALEVVITQARRSLEVARGSEGCQQQDATAVGRLGSTARAAAAMGDGMSAMTAALLQQANESNISLLGASEGGR